MTALERIAENKITKNPVLDLGNCGLTELPEELWECVWLENLNLGTWFFDASEFISIKKTEGVPNQLMSIRNIEKLINLEVLTVVDNLLTEIVGISKLIKLYNLDISGNSISDITEINKLKNLIMLDFSRNNVESIECLRGLKKLIMLGFTNNRVKNIDAVQDLKKLEVLGFSNNFVFDISNIKSLNRLIALDASENLIIDINPLEGLKKLSNLDISFNQILDLSPLLQIEKNFKKTDANLDFEENPITAVFPENIPSLSEKMKYWEKWKKKIRPTMSIFCNFTKKEIWENFSDSFIYPLEDADVRLLRQASELKENDDLVVLLLAYDEAENPTEIFDAIEKLQTWDKKYYVLLPSKIMAFTPDEINMERYAFLKKQHEDLRKGNPIEYDSLDDLEEKLATIAQSHTPTQTDTPAQEVILQSLTLENVGVYENISLHFHQNITCLVGLNGSGKTSILRALALALVGTNEKEPYKIREMVRISDFVKMEHKFLKNKNGEILIDWFPKYEKGKITLQLSVSGEIYANSVSIEETARGFKTQNDLAYPLAYHNQNMKKLVLGFTQNRTLSDKNDVKNIEINPHLVDIEPLINGKDHSNLMGNFEEWIKGLYNKANDSRGSEKIETRTEYHKLVRIFDVLSDIMGQKVSFLRIYRNESAKKQEDVIVQVPQNPNGIPLSLLSLGFKSVISWVGHLIKRMSQVYEDVHGEKFWEQSAICIIDEIDTYLHPNWQANFISALRKHFPNVQFVITTHSPLVLSALHKDQVVFLNGETLEEDTYGVDATHILQEMDFSYRAGEKQISANETIRVQDILDQLSVSTMNNDLEKSHFLLKQLKEINPDIPEISRFETIIRLKSKKI